MLSSLTPVGEGSRSQRWSITVTAFTIGSIVGGIGIAWVAGGLGVLLDPSPGTSSIVLAILLAVSVVADLAGVTPPSLRRQVDRTWMTRYRGWVYGVGYGVQLGTGLVTYITSWATWTWLLALVLAGDLQLALAMGAAHGLVRGISVWTTAGLTTPAAIRSHHRRLVGLDPWIRRGGHAMLVLAAVAVIATRVVG